MVSRFFLCSTAALFTWLTCFRPCLLADRFVQEAWMHPTLFVCSAGNKTSELDVAMGYGGNTDSARMALEMHWDTWIKEEDFAYLQKIGQSDLFPPSPPSPLRDD